MRFSTFIYCLLLGSACSYQQLPMKSKTIKYIGIFPEENNYHHKKIFYLDIPKGGYLDNRKTLTGDYHSEYRFVYSDSSIIYITNDESRGSTLNFKNRVDSGIDFYQKKHLLDTLSHTSLQKDGRSWKETVVGEIVVGYINVSSDKKELYDKALATIREKK